MRQLLIQIKQNFENENQQANNNQEEKRDARPSINESEEILNFDLTTRSNASQQQIKIQVMEELSPLRLVEVLNCSYSAGYQNYPMQFASLQLINQICDETPKNYKLICLSGILAHLKEFSKETQPMDVQELHNQSSNASSQQKEISPKEIKIEIAYFILKAYVTSNETVMMIFANQGYRILGQFLSISGFEENKLLIFMAIDVFLLHFDSSIQSILLPKPELTMIFSQENVSDKLAKILPHLILTIEQAQANKAGEDGDSLIAQKYFDKSFDLLQHLQKGNEEVKLLLCSKDLFQDCLVKFLS